MKSFVSILLLSLIASIAAFGVHTPLQVSRPATQRNGATGMVMRARICDLLGKRPNRQARDISFSHKRHKTVQYVNLQSKSYFSEDLGRNVRMRVSTKAMKTIEKYGGVDAAAKKFGVDLSKF